MTFWNPTSSAVVEETQSARQLRRLRELGRDSRMGRVNEAVRQVWDQPGGSRPAMIRIRPGFLLARGAGDERRGAPMSHLLNSRGVALRLYLLALFEAQCRPVSAEPSQNTRPLAGRPGCWGNLIAIDAAWSQPDRAYLHPSRQTGTWTPAGAGRSRARCGPWKGTGTRPWSRSRSRPTGGTVITPASG